MKKMNVWEQLIDSVADYLNTKYLCDKPLKIETYGVLDVVGGGDYPQNIADYMVDSKGNACVLVGIRESPTEPKERHTRNLVAAVLREAHRFRMQSIDSEAVDFTDSDIENFFEWMNERGVSQAVARELAADMTLGIGELIDYKIVAKTPSKDNLCIMLIYHNSEHNQDFKAIIDVDREDKNSKHKFKLKSMSKWNGTKRPEWVTYVPGL